MKNTSHYFIIMLLVLLFIFRLIVVFTASNGMEFIVKPININLEIVLLFIMLLSIILINKAKITATIILVIMSCIYYGQDLFKQIGNMSYEISMNSSIRLLTSIIGIMIPLFTFFIFVFERKQEVNPVNKETDFFYKNENYDVKYDDRADKNNYRIL